MGSIPGGIAWRRSGVWSTGGRPHSGLSPFNDRDSQADGMSRLPRFQPAARAAPATNREHSLCDLAAAYFGSNVEVHDGKSQWKQTPATADEHLTVRRSSQAEDKYHALGGVPGLELEEIAPGTPPTPPHDLLFHGGRTIPNLTFSDFHVGGDAWQPSDVQNIDSALAAAMSEPTLNNVMAQYFSGVPTRVFQEVPVAGGGTAPVQFQFSNYVHGPEGPVRVRQIRRPCADIKRRSSLELNGNSRSDRSLMCPLPRARYSCGCEGGSPLLPPQPASS